METRINNDQTIALRTEKRIKNFSKHDFKFDFVAAKNKLGNSVKVDVERLEKVLDILYKHGQDSVEIYIAEDKVYPVYFKAENCEIILAPMTRDDGS